MVVEAPFCAGDKLPIICGNHRLSAVLSLGGEMVSSATRWHDTVRLCDGTHTFFMCESDETHTTGWMGTGAHGLRTVIGCCKDRRRRRRRWTDLSRDLSNEQNATRTMPLSRNQPKSAENLRCQRNLFMYFQLTRSVLRYLIVKITNKFVGINTPRVLWAH